MDDLNPPPLTDIMEMLWMVYIEIRRGAAMVGYIELEAYQKITGNILTPWEANLMLEIDMLRNHG